MVLLALPPTPCMHSPLPPHLILLDLIILTTLFLQYFLFLKVFQLHFMPTSHSCMYTRCSNFIWSLCVIWWRVCVHLFGKTSRGDRHETCASCKEHEAVVNFCVLCVHWNNNLSQVEEHYLSSYSIQKNKTKLLFISVHTTILIWIIICIFQNFGDKTLCYLCQKGECTLFKQSFLRD
jgi:hypothetical protein